MNHPYTESDIIKYIRGGMSESEHMRFEEEMESNEELTDEVKGYELSITAIDRKGEDLFKQRFQKLEKRNVIWKWLSILAVLVSLVGIGSVVKKQFFEDKTIETKTIYADHFEKYRPPVSIRNNENLKADWETATEAYVSDDYEMAFDLFNARCDDINQEACFYAVLSSLYGEGNDYQSAKNSLKEDSPYKSILLWNEGLYFLKNDMIPQAIQSFDELEDRGDYKLKEVSIMKQQLRGDY